MQNKRIKKMSAHWYVPKIRVIAFRLGKLLSSDPWEREVEFMTLVEKKKKSPCMCLQETGGTGEIQVRKIMFVWNQNIMRK